MRNKLQLQKRGCDLPTVLISTNMLPTLVLIPIKCMTLTVLNYHRWSVGQALSISITIMTPTFNKQGWKERYKKFYPSHLLPGFLYLLHYLTLPGHSSERHLYYTLCREFRWPYMASDIYMTISDCQSCTVFGTLHCHKNQDVFFGMICKSSFQRTSSVHCVWRVLSINTLLYLPILERDGKSNYRH